MTGIKNMLQALHLKTWQGRISGLSLLIWLAAPAFAQSDMPPFAPSALDKPTLARNQPDQMISLNLKKVTLADLVGELGRKYHINIIADAFMPDQMPLGAVKVEKIPSKAALPNLAHLFGRQMTVVDGIVVWRQQRWWVSARQDDYTAEHYTYMKWKDRGRVVIERSDIATGGTLTNADASGSAPSVPATAGTPSPQGQDVEPAHRLSMEVAQASMQDVASAFSAQIGWKVTVDKTLAGRRLSAHLQDVTPGATLEALTFLLNSAQSVALGQTDGQRSREAQALEERADGRSAKDKASDALKEKLLGQLTDQQVADLQNGQSVSFDVGGLPTDLQQQALQYINMAADALSKAGVPPDTLPDLNQSSDSTLQLSPLPNFQVGVHGVTTNGTPVYY